MYCDLSSKIHHDYFDCIELYNCIPLNTLLVSIRQSMLLDYIDYEMHVISVIHGSNAFDLPCHSICLNLTHCFQVCPKPFTQDLVFHADMFGQVCIFCSTQFEFNLFFQTQYCNIAEMMRY